MTYSPAAAINKARELGFTTVSILTKRHVTIHQSWTTAGKEFAIFKLARGRDKGMTVGNAY